MAFDPIQEDCHRLILASMRRTGTPLTDSAHIGRCMDTYQNEPAKLIASDRDRSFHLVARAAETIDYRIPFLESDTEADRAAEEAENQLSEALELDRGNWDAQRMLAALDAATNDEYLDYLLAHRDEVERDMRDGCSATDNPYDREFSLDLARRPFLRWLAAISARALITGRYRMALDAAEESLAFAANDPADVRLTAMLALSKLECAPSELKRFRQRHAVAFLDLASAPLRRRNHTAEKAVDAWSALAAMNLAYRALDFDGATRQLRLLLRAYPLAAEVLYHQAELPEGIYARANAMPGSTDELVLAVSEATPLLQEGIGSPTSACFAAWIANHELVREALQDQGAFEAGPASPHAGGEA